MELIALPRTIVDRVKREATRLGITLEEYLPDLVTQNLDPHSRAKEYIETSKELVEEARTELEKGNVRQAAEKLRGATALAVKAYAEWRDCRRLASHGELWEYSLVLAKELGEWVKDSWAHANAMHICFYEGWCAREHVESALRAVEKIVKAVSEKIER